MTQISQCGLVKVITTAYQQIHYVFEAMLNINLEQWQLKEILHQIKVSRIYICIIKEANIKSCGRQYCVIYYLT